MNSVLWTLFITYFKIGLFTIGGGYAMIPLIQQEIVERYQWISLKDFTDFIAVAESTPGPFAVNTSTFIGMKVDGVVGALVTLAGVTLPSFIVILLIAIWMKGFAENRYIRGALYGMTPIVIALILSAAISLFITNVMDTEIGTSFNFSHIDLKAVLCCLIAGFFYYRHKLHPILLILISAGLGLFFYGLLPMLGIWT